MPVMPAQPSMIESWSFDDLRCNVYERERQLLNSLENDRPLHSPWGSGARRRESRENDRPGVSWARLSLGSASAIAGGLWLLSILGFEVPWFTVLPMALIVAGSFIIAAALNHGTAGEMTSHDRCDH